MSQKRIMIVKDEGQGVARKLKTVEHRFATTVKSINDAVLMTDAGGLITFVNPVAEELLGIGAPELLGGSVEKYFRIFSERTGLPLESPVHQVLHEGICLGFPGPAAVLSHAGRKFAVEASASPIKCAQGQIVGAVIIFRDVTERQEREARLAESETWLRAIINSEPQCVKLVGADGTLLEMNPAGLSMVEADSAAQVVGSKIYPMVDPPYRAAFQELIESTFRGESANLEFEITGLKGSRRWLETHAVPLRNPRGEVTASLGITRDITERKQTEEKLNKSREQLRSLAARLQSVREGERIRIAREIHDELGQMLTGFKMDLSWLERRLTEMNAQAAGIPLLNKMKTMSGLIDEMVQSVRKISSELRPRALDDLGLVPAMEWQALEFEERTGLECKFTSPAADIHLPPDHCTAVFRIFQEALTNVARHARATRVTLHLQTSAHHLVLEIRDNGRGITDEEVANSQSLGLLGMRERALILGGDVRIRGVTGEGTAVTVEVPLS